MMDFLPEEELVQVDIVPLFCFTDRLLRLHCPGGYLDTYTLTPYIVHSYLHSVSKSSQKPGYDLFTHSAPSMVTGNCAVKAAVAKAMAIR